MSTSLITYLGELRTEAIHLNSQTTILSDAPIDNQGKGQAFSPTDMVATSLATCMLTIMGIKARDMNLNLKGTKAEVTKHMTSGPRKISAIDIVITFLPNNFSEKDRSILENVAKTCPVALSLNTEIKQNLTFTF